MFSTEPALSTGCLSGDSKGPGPEGGASSEVTGGGAGPLPPSLRPYECSDVRDVCRVWKALFWLLSREDPVGGQSR